MKAECKWGHPYDEANTYVAPDGRRFCRACNRRVNGRKAAAASNERRVRRIEALIAAHEEKLSALRSALTKARS